MSIMNHELHLSSSQKGLEAMYNSPSPRRPMAFSNRPMRLGNPAWQNLRQSRRCHRSLDICRIVLSSEFTFTVLGGDGTVDRACRHHEG